ncbi:MAG TPA: hypothetical protein PKE32_00080 [Miltoncostaeaceae bacterium]|nr:hypothetical protein [Miltoncostaeaceae bacterium]
MAPTVRDTEPGAERKRSAAQESETTSERALLDGPWLPGSILKTGLRTADVDVRFEVDSHSRINVSMYDRISGELLRRIPPDRLEELIAANGQRGLIVDAER